MRKILKIFAFVAACVLAASCNERFTTSIELAVDYSDELGGMNLKTYKADTCYIHVTSNTDWNASLVFDGESWASLGMTSGSGQAWIPFYATANESGEERVVKFRVETGSASKKCEFTIIQPVGSL